MIACIRQHTSGYTTAYASIRQHTRKGEEEARYRLRVEHTSAYVTIHQHTSAYVSIRQHTEEVRYRLRVERAERKGVIWERSKLDRHASVRVTNTRNVAKRGLD